MSTELSKGLRCVVINGNVEVWVDADQATKVEQAIVGGQKYAKINGEFINTFSIVGVFSATAMEEKIRRRNGEWQCEHGEWWERNYRKCDCRPKAKTVKGYVKGVGEITYKTNAPTD